MAEIIDESRASYFNIIRKHIWENARLKLSINSFCTSKRIDVKFMDDLGTSEGAIDSGGPRREFLTLLIEHLKQGALFVDPDEAKFLNFNSKCK